MQPLLFDDMFEVLSKDPDGKKFDSGDTLGAVAVA